MEIYINEYNLNFHYQKGENKIIVETNYNDKIYTHTFISKEELNKIFNKGIKEITIEDFVSYCQIGVYYTEKHFSIIEDKINKHDFYNVPFLKEDELKNFNAIKNVINIPFKFEL